MIPNIPPFLRERLINAGKASLAAPEIEKPRYMREINRVTDELVKLGVCHPHKLCRPEFTPKGNQ